MADQYSNAGIIGSFHCSAFIFKHETWFACSFTSSTACFRSPSLMRSLPRGSFSCPASSATLSPCTLSQTCEELVHTLQRHRETCQQECNYCVRFFRELKTKKIIL